MSVRLLRCIRGYEKKLVSYAWVCPLALIYLALICHRCAVIGLVIMDELYIWYLADRFFVFFSYNTHAFQQLMGPAACL